MPDTIATTLILIFAGFWAGAQNALAGGGPLVSIAALMMTGMDARTANLTSTVALFPGQITIGWAARDTLQKARFIRNSTLAINIVGGAAGAALLLLTPSDAFLTMVPWLVLFATIIYAVSGLIRPDHLAEAQLSPALFLIFQAVLSIYGGYFGGGNSFMMLALLIASGLAARLAGKIKNLLIALINAAAVFVFLISGAVSAASAIPLAVGGIFGSIAGAWLLNRIDERALKVVVVAIGLAFSVWLFVRS